MNREDIDVTTIETKTSFRYAGKVFHGLEDLKKTSCYFYNKEKLENGSPYVVLVDKLYPCFDSEDYANEDRFYQNYYLTTDREKAERICLETSVGFERECRERGERPQYPILEPMFSMSKIEERHLPYIYYHGEGSFMEVVQNRNAAPEDKITVIQTESHYDFERIACLYGPPPGEFEPDLND